MAVNADSKVGLLGKATQWGRSIENRLDVVERGLNVTNSAVSGLRDVLDKTVYKDYNFSQNIVNGVNGKVALDLPTEVQFVSSTGLFEVTVSASGLVSYGSTLGVSFESNEFPYDVYFDMPKGGVVASCTPTDTRWVPFAGSRSTVVSVRPGIYKFSLYAYANCTATAQAVAFLHHSQISVKAV